MSWHILVLDQDSQPLTGRGVYDPTTEFTDRGAAWMAVVQATDNLANNDQPRTFMVMELGMVRKISATHIRDQSSLK